jgi:hypothetical protein
MPQGTSGAGAHCATCEAYERAVMARREGEPLSAQPCPAYVMSEPFKAWVVDAMRGEVMGQVSKAGLDRMAIAKAPAAKRQDPVP